MASDGIDGVGDVGRVRFVPGGPGSKPLVSPTPSPSFRRDPVELGDASQAANIIEHVDKCLKSLKDLGLPLVEHHGYKLQVSLAGAATARPG